MVLSFVVNFFGAGIHIRHLCLILNSGVFGSRARAGVTITIGGAEGVQIWSWPSNFGFICVGVVDRRRVSAVW